MARMYFGKTLMSPHTVDEKEVAKTKFGASIDMLIGEVDENGVLQAPTTQTELNFAGVTEIGDNALRYTFYKRGDITSVDLSSLITVDIYGLYYAFSSCTGITGVLDLSSLQTVGANGLYYAFDYCSGITSVDLSSLQSVGGYGLFCAFSNCTGITGALDLSSLWSVDNGGLNYAFRDCRGITGVDLSSLTTVGSNGMDSAFSSCKGITTISFPSLTSVQTNSLQNAFQSCTNLTEIHFRADMQATIKAMTGYSSRFGATNATIYFDL